MLQKEEQCFSSKASIKRCNASRKRSKTSKMRNNASSRRIKSSKKKRSKAPEKGARPRDADLSF